jgi:hypothetical protein
MIGAGAGVAVLAVAAIAVMEDLASAQTRPAYPGITCNLYGPRRFCDPYLLGGIGQDLRLTIRIGREDDAQGRSGDEIDTIHTLFAALRTCPVGPPPDAARWGMQMTLRFSLDRGGNIIGAPRVTYATHGIASQQRETYYNAIVAGLGRRTPFHLSNGMGGAVAGRPLIVRYIETRGQSNTGGDQ